MDPIDYLLEKYIIKCDNYKEAFQLKQFLINKGYKNYDFNPFSLENIIKFKVYIYIKEFQYSNAKAFYNNEETINYVEFIEKLEGEIENLSTQLNFLKNNN